MSERKRETLDGDGTAELTDASGPGDPGLHSDSQPTKGSRRMSASSERQCKVERAQKCLENAALVSKRIKEHRRATAQLLGKNFEEEESVDAASDAGSVSTRTGLSGLTCDSVPPISVEDALNIPGISESLANTLKQKEILMERIKQYKERSKERPSLTKPARKTSSVVTSSMPQQPVTSQVDLTKLQKTLNEKENTITLMQVKIKAMETTIHELQEKVSEKDSLLEAKTKATSLMSDNLSKKEKDSVNLLEDTRQQMLKMQENFIAMEAEWKQERERLLGEIEDKNEKIRNLEEANAILENARFEISLAHSKLSEEIEEKNSIISALEEKLSKLSEETLRPKENIEEEKGSQEISNMVEMTKRLELLEQLNCQIKRTNLELENKLATLSCQGSKTPEPSTPKKSSPQVTRKRGKSATRNPATKVKSPWTTLAESSAQDIQEKSPKHAVETDKDKLEMIIQSLNKELLEKEYSLSEKDAVIKSQNELIAQKESKPDTTDVGSMCDPVKTDETHTPQVEFIEESELKVESLDELQKQLTVARNQITALNEELELANKNMVKVKSAHKLKLKQMQKTIDNFIKMSDSNAEVSRLSEEVNSLTQKIAELEEDKGNLQLHLVDYDSGRLSESELSRKLLQLESLAEARLKSIADLETQKFELVQELHLLQQNNAELEDKLSDLQQMHGEHISTEMKYVQLEEQLDKAVEERKEIQLVVENLKLEIQQSNQSLKNLQDQNSELSKKLDAYVQENIDLNDRLEKLSAEKVSSAESIEMVESLTIQEKMELEEYNRKIKPVEDSSKIGDSSCAITEKENVDICDNIIKLSIESEELNKKIELFTQERHEVMNKMEKIKSENEELCKQINVISNDKNKLDDQIQSLTFEKNELVHINNELLTQIDNYKTELSEIVRENTVKRLASEEVSVDSESPPKETSENPQVDSGNLDEKPQISKSKLPKQMTKEILKLKNVIKEREAEIADCQMKILSLQEQQQKLGETAKNIPILEHTIKNLTDENLNLKDELSSLKIKVIDTTNVQDEQDLLPLRVSELLNEIVHIKEEHSLVISSKNEKIRELEHFVSEHHKQVEALQTTIQDKEKDINEYLNQISQLNKACQKLKSTVELLEEEKFKNQNADTVKNLNIQISSLQNLITEQELKIKLLEEELNNLKIMNSDILSRNHSLEADIQGLYNTLIEKDSRMKELQESKNRHNEEMSKIMNDCTEKDEEIHEIKLQLRKESIENENLRKLNSELSKSNNMYVSEIEDLKNRYSDISKMNAESNDSIKALENKNKELMEKLKKFAANLKKKSNVCLELENEITSLKSEIDKKQESIDAYNVQVLALTQEIECSKANTTEINKLAEMESRILTLMREKTIKDEQLKGLENNYVAARNEIDALLVNNASLTNELQNQEREALLLQSNIDSLKNKLRQYEDDISANFSSKNKIVELEEEIIRKQKEITNLLSEIEKIQEEFNTFKNGQEAKIQERDLFIENLESEISNYKSRIARLEESISTMEDRRHSLERKADQLGNQLEEKQKAYHQYSSHEDELVNRLALLMDHDQVVEKRLREIEKENTSLQNKIQVLLDENNHLKGSLNIIQEDYNNLKDKSNQLHLDELEFSKNQINQLEQQIKQIHLDHQLITKKHQEDIQNIESEFHNQIESNLKEKKSIIEKYEKEKETKELMQVELQQHVEHIKTLTENLHELHMINANLQNQDIKIPSQNFDYTEQYISEINKLQAIINHNSSEINYLQTSKSELQNYVSSLEAELSTLKQTCSDNLIQIENLKQDLVHSNEEFENLRKYTETLKNHITELEDKVQCHEIRKREPGVEKLFDHMVLEKDQISNQTMEIKSEPVNEDVIIPKKAYLCYDKSTQKTLQTDHAIDTQHVVDDPFNTEEGWGLGEKYVEYEEFEHNTNLQKLQTLVKENEGLKTDLQNVNTKLSKAMKKLKELKINNEKLSSELKQANHRYEINLLDNTIEDELKLQIQTLENEIKVITSDLTKEKKDKDAIAKQNEIFKNANDRFLEIKEKLENEVVMWKYKCKEVTDKFSSLDWEDNQTGVKTGDTSVTLQSKSTTDFKFMLEQVEKENDELNSVLEDYKKENLQLSTQLSKQNEEIAVLKNKTANLEDFEAMKLSFDECTSKNVDLNLLVDQLKQEKVELSLSATNKMEQIDALSVELSSYKNEIEHYNTELKELESECKYLKENSQLIIKERDVLEATLSDFKNENQKLQTERDNLLLNLEEIKTTCAILKGTNENIMKELASLKEKSSEKIDETIALELTIANEKSKTLEDSLNLMRVDLEKAHTTISEMQDEITKISGTNAFLENKTKELEEKCLQLNIENDKLLSTVTELQGSIVSAVDQRGYEVAEMWKHHLAQRESDFGNKEHELREQISSLEIKYQHLLDNVQSSSQEETDKMVAIEQLSSLQAKLKDKEEHLINLQTQHGELVTEMQLLRAEMEDEKVIHENKLLNQREEFEAQISEICNNNLKLEKEKDAFIAELNLHLESKEEANKATTTEAEELRKLVECLKNNITELRSEIHFKENEICSKTQEFNIILNQRNEEFESMRLKLFEYEKKIEDLTFEKESELATMRLKFHEQSTEYEQKYSKLEAEHKELSQSLLKKIEECTALNKQVTDLNKLLQEDSMRMSEMKTALESQELEIVTLKDEMDKLQILLESSTAKIAKHVTFASDTKPGAETDNEPSTETGEMVPKPELDLALYMVYQRNIRCEELTMELSSLLEERDTLQLRLSDSLRAYEELRSKLAAPGTEAMELKTAAEESQDRDSVATSSRASVGEAESLQTKLSELRSVRQSRDVRLRQESERRELDMQLLSRDVARLPAAAADQLRQAHYTISRESQSASSSLLGWLMGKGSSKSVQDM